MPITKKLTKLGNSQALVIDRPVLDLLNITSDTELMVTTDGTSLIITPVQDQGENNKKFEAALSSTNKRLAKSLKKLANS